MESIRAATIDGFNEFLKTQKAGSGTASIILNQFDDRFETVFDQPLNQAPNLTLETFQPRGSTALLDAIGKTVNDLGKELGRLPESERPEHVIVVIVTDGQENASLTYSLAQINQMITHQRDKYSWEFLFLGANQDAIATAAHMGIQAGSALNVASSPIGTTNSYAAMGRATLARRKGLGEKDFTPSERDAANKA